LRDADLALYAAKAAGKDRYALYDASVHADVETESPASSQAGAGAGATPVLALSGSRTQGDPSDPESSRPTHARAA
jgi:hypothetical protein